MAVGGWIPLARGGAAGAGVRVDAEDALPASQERVDRDPLAHGVADRRPLEPPVDEERLGRRLVLQRDRLDGSGPRGGDKGEEGRDQDQADDLAIVVHRGTSACTGVERGTPTVDALRSVLSACQ